MVTNETCLADLVNDKYANYVVQNCFSLAKKEQKLKLHKAFKAVLPEIKSHEFGAKIYQKIVASHPEILNCESPFKKAKAPEPKIQGKERKRRGNNSPKKASVQIVNN